MKEERNQLFFYRLQEEATRLAGDTHHLWVAQAVADRHAHQVDLHFGGGVAFMDVIRNSWNVLSGIRLHEKREIERERDPHGLRRL